MSVLREIENFILYSLAENKQLFSKVKDLVSGSLENLKRSKSESAVDHLREIEELRREAPESFNR